MSEKPNEGRVGGDERENIPAVPFARTSTGTTETVKNNSG
jgi:hypothetical protein